MENQKLRLALVLTAIIINSGGTYSQTPQLGGSVNMYARSRHDGESMKVMPMNDQWLFPEQIANVIKDPVALLYNPLKKNINQLFAGHLQIKFCKSVAHLLKSYFHAFQFDDIHQPWRFFNGNWSDEAIAERFGIDVSYIGKNYSYVLLKYSRYHEMETLVASPYNVQLVDTVAEEIERIKYKNVSSLVEFIEKFGSHYISSYTTGDALYQVFVHVYPFYDVLKDSVRKRGISEISMYELDLYFSPMYAVHVGSIKSTSGNHSLEASINKKFRAEHTQIAYSTLMRTRFNIQLTRQLRRLLRNESLLGLQLRSMVPLVKDKAKREWIKRYLVDPTKQSKSLTETLTAQGFFTDELSVEGFARLILTRL